LDLSPFLPFYVEHARGSRADDPALHIIPGQHGHIYPFGGGLLAISTAGRGTVAIRLRALPYIKVVQDGSDGINATFPVEHFQEVADLIRARRRRRLSPKARRAAAERLRKYQFSPAAGAQSEGQACVPIGPMV
jgi:hypothetical protein